MNFEKVHLFSLPQTWVFLDDQEDFLRSLELVVPADRPSEYWSNPVDCLRNMNKGKPHPFDFDVAHLFQDGEDILARFEIDRITRLASDPRRFEYPSVIIADYAMPGMSGLEFFAGLHDQRVKKILLTGVIDEREAVRAFNEGLIDRFVLKNEDNAIQTLMRYCVDLSNEKLQEIQAHLFNILPEEISRIVQSDELLNLLRGKVEEYFACEFYFSLVPLGFYILDEEGSAIFLALVKRSGLIKESLRLRGSSIPQEILRAIERGESCTFLFEEWDQSADRVYDWGYNTVQMHTGLGVEDWLWGIHPNPPIDINFDWTSCSLRSYLEATQGS